VTVSPKWHCTPLLQIVYVAIQIDLAGTTKTPPLDRRIF
jgi:hypothetical protein